MTQTQGFKHTATRLAAALVVVLAAGTFFYASRTDASYVAPANALHKLPAVTGVDTTSSLLW